MPPTLEAIAHPENICLAFLKASRGKKGRPEAVRWRQELHRNVDTLGQQILRGKLDVGHYRFFTVYDPKRREICAASFGERVLHHAMMNICEPELERWAIFDSYACRKGKGQHKAILRAQTFSRKASWYLKLDIKKYLGLTPDI